MKLLINTSTLYFGGGLQVALSFINELKNINSDNEYHIFLSKAINIQINKNDFDSNFYFYLIETSPAKFFTRKKILNIMNIYEKEINPEIVFSIFGPSYWTPKTKHVMGFADGWLYNPDSIAYRKLSIFKRIKMKLSAKYKTYYLKKDASNYILETNDAKKKFSKVLNIENEKIYVVGNTFSNVFDEKAYQSEENKYYISLPKKEKNEFRFMYIAHNHPAKNLAIINNVVLLLKDKNIKFVLTIDKNSYNEIFKENSSVINIGPIEQNSCPSIYKQCDALFAPTLLETFSAAYPESMIMKKPIITSKYSFASDICENAALYFNPLDPKDIVEKIKELINDTNLREKLVNNGIERLKSFETAKSRAEKYLEICNILIKKEENVQK